MTALLGTFVKMQTMADGGVRLILDMQCTVAELAAMGTAPGTPYGIARITNEASMQQESKQEQPKVSHENSKWLALRCKEPLFWMFLNQELRAEVKSEEDAAVFVRMYCDVDHRSELDANKAKADVMHRNIRHPYSEFCKGNKS